MAAVPFGCVEVVLEAVKRAHAGRFSDDADAYCAVKAPVFDLLMAGAELWAERTGWREPAGD